MFLLFNIIIIFFNVFVWYLTNDESTVFGHHIIMYRHRSMARILYVIVSARIEKKKQRRETNKNRIKKKKKLASHLNVIK